jgi:hypothetical protein
MSVQKVLKFQLQFLEICEDFMILCYRYFLTTWFWKSLILLLTRDFGWMNGGFIVLLDLSKLLAGQGVSFRRRRSMAS